jgi:hypothetical protein
VVAAEHVGWVVPLLDPGEPLVCRRRIRRGDVGISRRTEEPGVDPAGLARDCGPGGEGPAGHLRRSAGGQHRCGYEQDLGVAVRECRRVGRDTPEGATQAAQFHRGPVAEQPGYGANLFVVQ